MNISIMCKLYEIYIKFHFDIKAYDYSGGIYLDAGKIILSFLI